MPSGEGPLIENLTNDKRHRAEIIVGGEFVNQDKGEDTDEWALERIHCSSCSIRFNGISCHTRTQHLEME
jgi:hypothetical protein